MEQPILISRNVNCYTVFPYAVIMGMTVLGFCTYVLWITRGRSIGIWFACLFLCGLGYLLIRITLNVPQVQVYLTTTHLIERQDGQEHKRIPLTSINRVHVPLLQMGHIPVAIVYYQDAEGQQKSFRFTPEPYGLVPGRKRHILTFIYKRKQYYGAEMLDAMAAQAQGKKTLDI